MHWTIKRKLALIVLTFAAGLVLLAAIFTVGTGRMSADLEQVAARDAALLRISLELAAAKANQAHEVASHLYTRDAEAKDAFLEYVRDYNAWRDSLRAMSDMPATVATHTAALDSLNRGFMDLATRLMDHTGRGEWEAAGRLYHETHNYEETTAAALEGLRDAALTSIADHRLAAATRATGVTRLAWLVPLILLLVLAPFARSIALGIVHNTTRVLRAARHLQEHDLRSLRIASEALAEGNLTAARAAAVAEPVPVEGGDEIAQLAASINDIIAETRGTAVSFDRAASTVGALLNETDRMTSAARTGQLGVRGETERFTGAYRQLVHGLNEAVTAFATPLRETVEVLQRVAERDLQARLSGRYEGDIAGLEGALRLALTNLGDALAGVSAASRDVGTAAEQISTSSSTLAQAATDQASAIQEVSAQLQQVTAMASRNTAGAAEAASIAETTQTATRDGVADMERLSEAIGAIKSTTDETAKIIRTINDIAFQTNLLALNAAVEAARAGDAGRGFAVVAEEVRGLALRSAEAARQTTELLEESVRRAAAGVSLNGHVLERLHGIDREVTRVREVVQAIAEASSEQRSGVEQIAVAVSHMERLTQATAAQAEESAAASAELRGQSRDMQARVGEFRL